MADSPFEAGGAGAPGAEPFQPATDEDVARAEAEAAAAAAAVDPAVSLVEVVPEETVRDLLRGQGALVHALFAVDPASTEWVYVQAELDAIAPPLTRIVNRYQALAAIAKHGDVAGVGLGLFAYGKRSLGERVEAIARAQAAAAPAPGQAAFRLDLDGGTGG